MDDEEVEGNIEWQNQSSSMGYGLENLSEEEREERRGSKNNNQNYNQENSHDNAQDSEKEGGNPLSNGDGDRKASSDLEGNDYYPNLDRHNDNNDDEERKPPERKKREDIGVPITLGRRLYIGNLDGVVNESDIRAVFDEFGKIITLFIPERGDGRKKYALLTFNETHEAESAMKELSRRSKIENGESVSGEEGHQVEEEKVKEFYLTIKGQRVKIEWSSHVKNKEKRNIGRFSNPRRGDYNSRPRQGWDRRDHYDRDRDDYRYRDNYRESNYRDRDSYYYDRDRERDRDGSRRDPRDNGGGGYGRGDRDSYRPAPSYRNEDFDRDRNNGYRSYGSRDREREAPPRDYYRSDYERDYDRGRERGREGERERVGSWDGDADRSRRGGYSDSYKGLDRDDQYRRDRNEF